MDFKPVGNSTVSPYLMVTEVSEVLEFARQVFDAEILEELRDPDGKIMHGEFKVGDSLVMVGRARTPEQAESARLFVWVKEVDAAFQKALQAGAKVDYEPRDQFYGVRDAGVIDTRNITWYLATRIEDVTVEEMERRLREGKA